MHHYNKQANNHRKKYLTCPSTPVLFTLICFIACIGRGVIFKARFKNLVSTHLSSDGNSPNIFRKRKVIPIRWQRDRQTHGGLP
jgi:hypothetical protein